LLEKARGDEQVLCTLAGASGIPGWAVGFHAQQTVEKCIKAVLAARVIHYPYTHDIEGLIELVEFHRLALPPDSDELPRLTPFGSMLRYDSRDPPPVDSEWAVAVVRRTIEWAERIVSA